MYLTVTPPVTLPLSAFGASGNRRWLPETISLRLCA
jgi:hypothetical protein